jgi:murein DD-endopeptidase MepM/ murein hydrolase activator NlpD
MSTNISLRFLVLTGVFLSAEVALAQNSFSTVQTSLANNTLATKLSSINHFTHPKIVNDDSLPDPKHSSREISDKNSSVVFAEPTLADRNSKDLNDPASLTHQDLSPSDRQVASSSTTQSTVFLGDVANLEHSYKISAMPPQAQPEISIAIPVPPPRTQVVKVQPVTHLPQVVRTHRIPTVIAMPTMSPATANSATPKPIAFVNNGANESNVELIYPLMTPAPITSGFGWRTHPLSGIRRFHSGIDIGAPSGAPVVATGSGTVVSAGWNGGYGKAVIIQHNGVQQTLYGHLSEISVQAGQVIPQGTVIGLVGSTGNSTGPHLHFENRMSTTNGWIAVDPSQEIQYAVDNLRRSMPFAQKELPPGL